MGQTTPDCLERTVPVGIRMGQSVDLTKLHFRATSRGQPIQVFSASVAVAPRRVVLLVDTSGSMGPAPVDSRKPRIEYAFKFADEAVSKLPAAVSLALILFGENEERLDFAAGRGAIAQRLESTQSALTKLAHGRTRLYDAILDGVALLSPFQPGDAVYVITDGEDNLSKADRDKVRRALLASGTRLFLLLLNPQMVPIEDVRDRENLRMLAVETGGESLYVGGRALPWGALTDDSEFYGKTRAQLAQATAAIYEIMGVPNLVRVRLPRAPGGFQKWKLEMLDAEGRASKDVMLSYPRELAPCEKR